MEVTKEKVVSLTYELRQNDANGKIIETLTKDSPLTFLFGTDNLLPKFEENIDGLKVGDSFDFNLEASEAYGSVNIDAIINVPVKAFEIDGKIDDNMLKLGNKIPMQDASGNKLSGVVKEITEESVKMDFNHPLAGKDLFFKGEITDIREATEEELHHGHAHYPGSCEGCSDCGGEGGHC
ncbi:MAG: peptidylprolyl isomerase [Bacteroidales bacterium]|nr:peptidylprolyl isomerase [Bacteroidales bacterium]